MRNFAWYACATSGVAALLLAACRSGAAGGSAELTCSQLGSIVQRQFSLAAVTVTCSPGQERTASVEVADGPLFQRLQAAADTMQEQAVAERIARSIWARAGIEMNVASIMVALSADTSPQAAGVMYDFGRGLISYWTVEAEDTTRRCLIGGCP